MILIAGKLCCQGIFNRSMLKRLNYEVVKKANLMGGEIQDQGQIDQDLEEWFSPRGSQSVHGFFSEEENRESLRIEYLAPEGEIINNIYPEEETSTMVVIKW